MAIVEEWMFFNTFLVDLEESFTRWRLIETALPVCAPVPRLLHAVITFSIHSSLYCHSIQKSRVTTAALDGIPANYLQIPGVL